MKVIDWIKKRFKEFGADSEGATDRDGGFSHAAEVHAFGIGVARGAQDPWHLVSPLPEGEDEHFKDARDEPGYYWLGCIVGTGLQLGLLGLAAALGYVALP